MSCKITIDKDSIFSTIYEKTGNDFSTSLSIYSELNKNDDLLSKNGLNAVDKVKFIIKSRLNNIDRLMQDKNQNKFKLTDEANKFESILAKLESESDLGAIYQAINEQIELVQKEIEKPNVTIQQLENYYRIINQFSNLSKEIMDETEILEENVEIEKQASVILKRINKKLMEQVKDIAAEEGLFLTDKDITRLEETNWANSRTLDITADKNKFVQYVAKTVLDASAKRDLTLKQRMDKLEEKRLKLGTNEKERIAQAQRILRNGKFNQLIDKYSARYHETVSAFNKDINAAKKLGKPVKDILQKRNRWFKDNTISVDPQIFLNAGSPTAENKIKLLSDKLGSEENARKLINKAQKKYEAYQKELENYTEYVNSDDTLTDEVKKDLINQFKLQNSPDIYYGIFHDNMYDFYKQEYNITGPINFTSKYIVSAPLKIDENGRDLGYYDSVYESVKNDEALFEYYREVKTIMNEWKQYLPDYVKDEAKSENYIFRAKANLVETFNNFGLKAFWNQLDDNVRASFSTDFQNEYVQEVDAEGKPVKSIPISTLRNLDFEKARIEAKLSKPEKLTETQIKALETRLEKINTAYTIDPSKSIEVFLAMATNYKFMSEIQSQVEAANYIIQQAKQRNLDGTSDTARNVKERLQYFIDSNLYNQRTEIEGQHKEGKDFKDNVFSTSDLVGKTSEKKKLAKELAKQIEALQPRMDELYTKKEESDLSEDEKKEMRSYAELVEEYRMLGGKRFTWSKLADRVIEWTALKTFGLNPFSPIANVVFGMISTFIEGSGGQHFTNEQAVKAFGVMLNSTGKYLSMGGLATEQATKISSIMERLGVVEDSVDVKYGRNRLQETKTSKALSPYNWMRSSDFFMKGVSVIAMMSNPNNKFNQGLVTKDGKTVTLWESFDEKGNWKSDMFSDEINEKWSNNFIDGNGQRLIEFKNYVDQVEKSQHGNFNRNTPVLAKKNAIGRLVGQFRLSWMAEGFKQRFANKYYDSILQEDVEGRYKTFYRLLSERDDLASNYFKSIIGLMFKMDKVSDLTELDKANLKKIKADLLFYTTFMMLMILLKSWWDDDEDGKIDNGAGKLIYNQLTQAQGDISFYLSPQVFKTFTSNLIPALSIYTDLTKTQRAVFKYIDTGEEDDAERMWNKIFKNFPFTRTITTINSRSNRLLEDYVENN